MTANYWVALTIFVLAVGAMIYATISLSKDPKNAGQEPGRIFLRIGITYTLSWLIVGQIFLNMVEAGIVGSIQDPGINTAARMGGHFLIAGFGILGALTWIKSFREMIAALYIVDKDGKKAPGSHRYPLALICFILMLMGFVASIAAPLANMYVLANATHNVRELGIFIAAIKESMGIISLNSYLLVLAEAGAKPSYSPLGGLAGVMLFSIIVTFTHMFVCFWEVLFALKLSMTKDDMTKAFETDIYADKVPKEKGKDGKDKDKGGKDKDEEGDDEDKAEKDKKKKGSQHKILEGIFKFMGMSEEDSEKWGDRVYPLLTEAGGGTVQDTATFSANMSELWRKIQHFESKGEGPKKETAEMLESELRKLVSDRSKKKLSVPRRKKS